MKSSVQKLNSMDFHPLTVKVAFIGLRSSNSTKVDGCSGADTLFNVSLSPKKITKVNDTVHMGRLLVEFNIISNALYLSGSLMYHWLVFRYFYKVAKQVQLW